MEFVLTLFTHFSFSDTSLTKIEILYLQHYHTDLFDTLDDGFWGSRDCHGTFCGVRQHVPCHLNLGPCGLEYSDGHLETLQHTSCAMHTHPICCSTTCVKLNVLKILILALILLYHVTPQVIRHGGWTLGHGISTLFTYIITAGLADTGYALFWPLRVLLSFNHMFTC